jgi:hypothetical protein
VDIRVLNVNRQALAITKIGPKDSPIGNVSYPLGPLIDQIWNTVEKNKPVTYNTFAI